MRIPASAPKAPPPAPSQTSEKAAPKKTATAGKPIASQPQAQLKRTADSFEPAAPAKGKPALTPPPPPERPAAPQAPATASASAPATSNLETASAPTKPSGFLGGVLDAGAKVVGGIVEGGRAVGEAVSNGVEAVGEGIQNVGEGIAGGIEVVGEGIQNVGEGIASGVKQGLDTLGNVAEEVGDRLEAGDRAFDREFSQSEGEGFLQRTDSFFDSLVAGGLETLKDPTPSGDQATDGQLLGADGLVDPGTTPASEVRGVQPTNGPANGRSYYINGQTEDAAGQAQSLQTLANETGREVVGIRNATEGLFEDTVESGQGKLADVESAPVATLANAINADLEAGKPVHILAHSQGAIVTAQALEEVNQRLLDQGLTPDQAREKLSAIQVETFGGASSSYPVDGPQYRHYVNGNDLLVANPLGVGPIGQVFGADPGEGGVVIDPGGDGHGLADAYLPGRPDGGFDAAPS